MRSLFFLLLFLSLFSCARTPEPPKIIIEQNGRSTNIHTEGNLVSSVAATPEPPIDVVDKVIIDLFRNQGGHALCMLEGESRQSVREALKDRLQGIDTNDVASANAIAIAVYTTFPCPFSPYRPELRLAKTDDLTGNWLFPEGSQRLRYGPKSKAWQSNPGMPPLKCEGVSYLENGVLLVVQVHGTGASCPTSSFMKALEKYPKVEAWTLIRDGRVKIDRTDISDHVEEWDIFVVENTFDFAKTQFAAGDLVGYFRRFKNNDFNAATMFRHLQRMP